MEYHDPLNASLVVPFQRPRDGRSTLPILPSLPQLGLLRCREPNPRRHHGTPPAPRKIRRCCADRLNPPPETGHWLARPARPKSAITGSEQVQQDTPEKARPAYSITSSARASSVAGTSRPSARAVTRLMIRSNLVGCSTGKSAGLGPRKILSTYPAARR